MKYPTGTRTYIDEMGSTLEISHNSEGAESGGNELFMNVNNEWGTSYIALNESQVKDLIVQITALLNLKDEVPKKLVTFGTDFTVQS